MRVFGVFSLDIINIGFVQVLRAKCCLKLSFVKCSLFKAFPPKLFLSLRSRYSIMLWYKCWRRNCPSWSCSRPATYRGSADARSWRSCWRLWAPSPAAERLWFVTLWTGVCSLWILHVKSAAGHQWRPVGASWRRSPARLSRDLVLFSYMLKQQKGDMQVWDMKQTKLC